MKRLLTVISARKTRESRCDTCSYARIMRGYMKAEKVTFCGRVAEIFRIAFPVSECTDYHDKRIPFTAPPRKVGFTSALDGGDSPEQAA